MSLRGLSGAVNGGAPQPGFRAHALSVALEVDDRRLEIRYRVDDRGEQLLAVQLPHEPVDDAPALDVVIAAAAIYLGSLCLAEEIRISRPLSPGLLDDLVPLIEMLYDIRRWKDDLPLGPRPSLQAPARAAVVRDPRPLDRRAAANLWSGGKDSTLALMTLRTNGLRTRSVHVRANVGVEDAEQHAVEQLAGRLDEPFDVLSIEHRDFAALTNAYADAWDSFPYCNRVPFGRDLLLGALGAVYALEVGTANVSLGHDRECREADVVHHGKRVMRNDLESARGALCLEAALRRHVHEELRLLPPVANLSELRILRDMFVHHADLMETVAFCFWGDRCGRCAKCLRYYLADRLYGDERLRFAVNPLAEGACPELRDHLDPAPRSTLFQTEVLVLLGRLAARGDVRPDEHELHRFRERQLDAVQPLLDRWEGALLAWAPDPQVPHGFRPLHPGVAASPDRAAAAL